MTIDDLPRPLRAVLIWGPDLDDETFMLQALAGPDESPVTVIAADVVAAAGLTVQGRPFTTVDEWSAPDGPPFAGIQDRANALMRQRCAQSRSVLIPRSHPRPSVEPWEQEIWKTLIVAVRLASGLDKAGLVELRLARPGEASQRLIHSVLQEALGSRVRILSRPESLRRNGSWIGRALRSSLFGAAARWVRARWSRRNCERRAAALARSAQRPLLLLALSRRELNRSRPILRRLAAALGGDAIALPWVTSHDALAISASVSDFPIAQPSMSQPDSRLLSFFLTREIRRSVRDIELGDLEIARRTCVKALEDLVPDAVQQARRLVDLRRMIERMEPDAVVTARVDRRSLSIIETIASVSARVITLPHGVVDGSAHLVRHQAIHLSGIDDPTVPRGAVRYAEDALVTHEYPERTRRVSHSVARLGSRPILAVSDGVDGESCLAIRDHLALLRDVARAAEVLRDSHTVIWKPHPGVADVEKDLLAGPACSSSVVTVPRDADLFDLLKDTHALIAVNCYGSALVHAAGLGVPILRLWPRSLTDHKESDPSGWPAYWINHTYGVGSSDDLVTALRRIDADPRFRRDLEDRSRRVMDALRPTGRAESLEDILRRSP